ncbi:hypothetical protein DFO70_1441, partial [Cytobacillus firmus]
LDADKIAKDIECPLFIGHGKDNLLHPVEESLRFYDAATDPKQLFIINGKHNDFMYHEHSVFQDLIGQLKQFFGKCLHYEKLVKIS